MLNDNIVLRTTISKLAVTQPRTQNSKSRVRMEVILDLDKFKMFSWPENLIQFYASSHCAHVVGLRELRKLHTGQANQFTFCPRGWSVVVWLKWITRYTN